MSAAVLQFVMTLAKSRFKMEDGAGEGLRLALTP
jgi:hypothetical protein